MITELNKDPGPWRGWKIHWKKNSITALFVRLFVEWLQISQITLSALDGALEYVLLTLEEV
jgi:hypothetical protein